MNILLSETLLSAKLKIFRCEHLVHTEVNSSFQISPWIGDKIKSLLNSPLFFFVFLCMWKNFELFLDTKNHRSTYLVYQLSFWSFFLFLFRNKNYLYLFSVPLKSAVDFYLTNKLAIKTIFFFSLPVFDALILAIKHSIQYVKNIGTHFLGEEGGGSNIEKYHIHIGLFKSQLRSQYVYFFRWITNWLSIRNLKRDPFNCLAVPINKPIMNLRCLFNKYKKLGNIHTTS